MRAMRESGILLHPTCLPNRFGIGDLGDSAYDFVEWLAAAGQRYWQVLPLGPVDDWGSPYSSASAFAGNELLISLEKILAEGLLEESDLSDYLPVVEDSPVNYQNVAGKKRRVLRRAFARIEQSLRQGGHAEFCREFASFCRQEAWWLKHYATYQALLDYFGHPHWNRWDYGKLGVSRERLVHADFDGTGENLPLALREEYLFHCFIQYLFARQWQALHRFAQRQGVLVFGDVPIYVSYHSADVWAHPEYFLLDEHFRPIEVAGVPPDYFNATGQLWGNPIYRWEVLARNHFRWWMERFQAVFRLVDLIRIDHFRGFVAYWSVPAHHQTAEHGRWIPAPGEELFRQLINTWQGPWRSKPDGTRCLPIVAEDLGHITPDVVALRKRLGFPGMAVLQFAFGPSRVDQFLPDRVAPDTVMYTGTHDNDTSLGWFIHEVAEDPELVSRLRQYCNPEPSTVSWEMLRLAFESRSEIAIVPLQDVFGLGSEARMNIPGTPNNNWRWRFSSVLLTEELAERLYRLTEQTGRLAAQEVRLPAAPQ